MERKRHRVFLDSGVILSGLFSDRGAPRLILDMMTLDLPTLTGLTGRLDLLEIERNIRQKLPDALSVWGKCESRLRLEVVPVPSSWDLALLGETAESMDLPVVASAINGKADFFVSGDNRLLSRLEHRPDILFRAASPTGFLGSVLPKILSGKS